MAIYEQDVVMFETKENGDKTIKMPISRANNIEGIGRSISTAYAVGEVVYVDNNKKVALKCTTAGTTSNTELDVSGVSIGNSLTDGSVVWKVIARSNVLDEDGVVPIINGGTGGELFIQSASINGRAITLTFADGTTKTLTTQDTGDTHYMPNFAGTITCSTPTNTEQSYTAPSDGYMSIQVYGFYGSYGKIIVDGQQLYYGSGVGNSVVNTMTAFFPVTKGTVIKYQTASTLSAPTYTTYCKFIPAKTV